MPDEFKDKISDEDKKVITDAVEEAKKHKDSDDKDELEAAGKALNDAIMPIGAKLYEAASKEDAPASEDAEKKDDEPVEGEVVDKDEKKK
jgi:molecular chaperone DnaK